MEELYLGTGKDHQRKSKIILLVDSYLCVYICQAESAKEIFNSLDFLQILYDNFEKIVSVRNDSGADWSVDISRYFREVLNYLDIFLRRQKHGSNLLTRRNITKTTFKCHGCQEIGQIKANNPKLMAARKLIGIIQILLKKV